MVHFRVIQDAVHQRCFPKGPKYLYGTKYGFCSSNSPYGLSKYSLYWYLGPFGFLERVSDVEGLINGIGSRGQVHKKRMERLYGKNIGPQSPKYPYGEYLPKP